MKLKWKQGFSLIELMVVVGIIVVLATLAMTSYGAANKKARNSRRMADLEQLRSAMELYRTDEGVYPDQAERNASSYFDNVSLEDPQNNVYWINLTAGGNGYEICSVWEGSGTPPRVCSVAAQGDYGVLNP